jgi:hypothetical protein
MTHTINRSLCGKLVNMIIELGAKRVTKYISPKLTVKATHQGKHDRRDKSNTVLVTIGRPNYSEREFIKTAQKAGEPFPVKKVQIKWPKQKAKAAHARA